MRYILNIILAISFVFAQDAAEIIKKIKESGLSESQIRQMAKQRGMSDGEIDAKAKELGLGDKAAEGQVTQPTIEDIPEVGAEDVSIQLPETTEQGTIQENEQPLETIESSIEDYVEQEGLDIVEDNLILESKGQPDRQAVN